LISTGEAAVSSPGLPSTRETWTYWRESSKGPLRPIRDWNISPMRRGGESWDCSAWKREGWRVYKKLF